MHQMLKIKPIAGSLGAEIEGIDLSQPLNNSQATSVSQALLDHKVIFFRDQELTPEDHLRVSTIFGTVYQVPFVQSREGYPDIIEIIKEPEDAGKFNFGGVWHSDTSFEKEPSLGSTLWRRHPTVETHFGPTWRPPTQHSQICLLYTSPSPRDRTRSRMPSSA